MEHKRLQPGAEQAAEKLPLYTSQHNKNCSSNSTVWQAYEDEASKLTTPCSDPEIQEGNQAAKAKMKEHADNKRYVKPSNAKEGDTVLVRRDDSKKKSDTPYGPRPHIILEKKGAMVTAENDDGIQVKRNSSFFKSVSTARE